MAKSGNGLGISKVEIRKPSIGEKVEVVVAQDGSGDYKTIQEAV